MKTNYTPAIAKKLPMIARFFTILAGIIILWIGNISAQRIAPEKEVASFNLASERETKIERFSIRNHNGYNYLQWHVKNEREDGIFIIQRSANMMDFKIVGIKHDVPSEADISLMFNIIDKNPIPGISFYRIIKVYGDNSYYFSDVESVEFNKPQQIEGNLIN